MNNKAENACQLHMQLKKKIQLNLLDLFAKM